MSGVWQKLVAVVVGLLFFCVAAEIISRMVFSHVINFDVEMWRYAREVKTSGLTPGLRFEHNPGANARLMGVDVVINQDGLREREVGQSKPPGVFRVAVIGDSITFGWGVEQGETLSRQLETLLNRQQAAGSVRFEVLNFGVGNYAISDVAAMLETKAIAYSPDMVIYGAFINDAETRADNGASFVMQHSVFATWLWGRVDALLRLLDLREDYRHYYSDLYSEGSAGRLAVRANLAKIADICIARKIPFVVAFLPELHDDSQVEFASVVDFYAVETRNVDGQFVNLYNAISNVDYQQFWVSHDDAHPNSKAFQRYASEIFARIPWSDYAAPVKDSVESVVPE